MPVKQFGASLLFKRDELFVVVFLGTVIVSLPGPKLCLPLHKKSPPEVFSEVVSY